MRIQDFKDTLTGDTFVAVTATWCGPCKMLKPILAGLAEDNKSFNYTALDADEDKEIIQALNIRSVPTFMKITKDLEVVSSLIGSKSRSQVIEFLGTNGLPNVR